MVTRSEPRSEGVDLPALLDTEWGIRYAPPYRGMYDGLLFGRAMDRLLTAGEVAERLGVRTDWVSAQARAGRIPHVRLGRYRRFRESALEAWLSGLEAASTKPSGARAVPLRRSA